MYRCLNTPTALVDLTFDDSSPSPLRGKSRVGCGDLAFTSGPLEFVGVSSGRLLWRLESE